MLHSVAALVEYLIEPAAWLWLDIKLVRFLRKGMVPPSADIARDGIVDLIWCAGKRELLLERKYALALLDFLGN